MIVVCIAGRSNVRSFLNAAGQSLGVYYGNGLYTTNAYFANSKRVQRIQTSALGGGWNQDLQYTYDKVANLKSITDGVFTTGITSASISSVTYDDLHRLQSLYSTAYGATRIFAYSSIGNILTNGEAVSGTGYSYGWKPHAVTNAFGRYYAYDACGNMTYRGTGSGYQALSYDEENHLKQVTVSSGPTVSFGYDGGGQRLWRYSTTSQSYTIWIGGIYEERDGKVLCHVFAGGRRVATFEPQGGSYVSIGDKDKWVVAEGLLNRALTWPMQQGRAPWSFLALAALGMAAVTFRARRDASAVGKRSRIRLKPGGLWKASVTLVSLAAFLVATTPMNVSAQTYDPVFYYYHPDHLGSTTILTDRSGDRVDIYQNTAFGREQYHVSTGAFAMSNRFTGQVLDDETGLYYYNARYYDPEIGRFIQPDNAAANGGDPQMLNHYSYVRNNPFRWTDPTGHFIGGLIAAAISVVVVAAIGAAVGAAYAAYVGGDIGEGALTGAVGAALSYIGSMAGPIGSIAGGAAAGAVNAEITGGDPAKGAMYGAATAAVASCVGYVSESIVLNSMSEGLLKDVSRAAISASAAGAEAELTGGNFWQSFTFSTYVSAANIANGYARLATKGSSERDTYAPDNEEGQLPDNSRNEGLSSNFFKDRFGRFIKFGGARWDQSLGRAPDALFGSGQGGPGSIFGIPYKPGSFGDNLVEAFSGLHDLLNSAGYNQLGDAKYTSSPFFGALREVQSAMNIGFTAPFAAASMISAFHPTLMADAPVVDRFTGFQ